MHDERPDWQLLQTFVRVAEAGSLTAGAKALGISQPTASRHVAALEEALGVTLFVRHARGLHLSDRGAELLMEAREIDDHVQALLLRATGLREAPRGNVRISTAEPVGAYVLGPCIAALRARYPDITLELTLDNQVANLSRREADLAVRMFRPAQPDLVIRALGQVPLGFFASEDYLRRHGAPVGMADMAQHTFIGFDRDPSWARLLREYGLAPGSFRFRTDSIVAQVQAMLDGVGITGTHLQIAARYPSLRRVLPEVALPPLDMYLVMHRDVRNDPAVRAVADALGSFLADYIAEGARMAGAC